MMSKISLGREGIDIAGGMADEYCLWRASRIEHLLKRADKLWEIRWRCKVVVVDAKKTRQHARSDERDQTRLPGPHPAQQLQQVTSGASLERVMQARTTKVFTAIMSSPVIPSTLLRSHHHLLFAAEPPS